MAIVGRRYLCLRRVAIFIRGRPKKVYRKRAWLDSQSLLGFRCLGFLRVRCTVADRCFALAALSHCRRTRAADPNYKAVYGSCPPLACRLSDAGHMKVRKAYRDAFELVHRREADRPNAIWQADRTLLDIMLVRDATKAAKPWLTVVLDD
jgi:hypothetical protein